MIFRINMHINFLKQRIICLQVQINQDKNIHLNLKHIINCYYRLFITLIVKLG